MSVYATGPSRPPDVGDYAAYVHRRRRPPQNPAARRGAGAGGPLAGLPPEIRAILGLLPQGPAYTPMTDADIRARAAADAQSILGPLIERQQQDYLARLKAGSAAITGYTGTFADRVGALGPEVAQLFSGAGQVEDTTGQALAAAQGRANKGGIQAFASELGLMNAPGQDAAVGTQKALSKGGTQLTKAYTADELARITNEAGAQQGYWMKQPGIAALEGGTYMRDYTTSLNNALGAALSDINQSAPGLVQQLVSDYYSRDAARQGSAADRATNRAQLAATLYNALADRNQTALIYGLTAAQKRETEQLRHQEAMARAKTAAERAREIARHNTIMEGIAATNAAAATTSANASATRAANAGQPKPITWQSVVTDAAKTARGMGTPGGLFGGTTRPSWNQAFNALTAYLHRKYPKLTPAQIKSAVLAGLHGAGYQPGGGSTGAGPTQPPPPPSS